jgi:O-antigen ligase
MCTLTKPLLTFPSQQQIISVGCSLTGLFLLAIYFSTALAIILSAVLALLWLLSGQLLALPSTLQKFPVAAWALLLYICFIAGLGYGQADPKEAHVMLSKYRELLLLTILLPFLSTERYRNWAWKAFIAASVLSLSVSYLMDMGVLDSSANGPSWKSRITHSLFMAFFAFYCLHKTFAQKPLHKPYFAGFLLAFYNLFFVVEGRSGQLIALALLLLFAIQRLSNKQRSVLLLCLIVFLGLFLGYSGKAKRIHEGFANTQAYFQSHPEQTHSSMGQRYTFWQYSLKLIAEKPWSGHGTGSFSSEYYRLADKEHFKAQHPHNEFLMIAVQLGLLGLAPYLGFLVSQWVCASALPDQDRWLAQGLFVSLLIFSLFNTPIFDHTEGHWFALMIALCFSASKPN